MKKAFLVVLIMVSAGLSVQGRSIVFEVKGSYFFPSERAFKDIYGSGFMIGGEISLSIWRNLDLWAGGEYFSRYGELSFTKEESSLVIIPLGGGLKYRIKTGPVSVYGGAGAAYFSYQESNVLGDIKSGAAGFISKIGAYLEPVNNFILDVFVEYSYCRMTPADFTVDIGGLKAGFGLGVRI